MPELLPASSPFSTTHCGPDRSRLRLANPPPPDLPQGWHWPLSFFGGWSSPVLLGLGTTSSSALVKRHLLRDILWIPAKVTRPGSMNLPSFCFLHNSTYHHLQQVIHVPVKPLYMEDDGATLSICGVRYSRGPWNGFPCGYGGTTIYYN